MSMPPTRTAPRRPGRGEPVEQPGIDEGRVQAVKHLDEAVDHLPKGLDRLGEVRRSEPATQIAGIVRHGLDAKDALAFRVDLQHQAPEANAQDRQIELRCLERDLHDRSSRLPLVSPRTLPASEEGLHGAQVQRAPDPVDQGAEDPVHPPAAREEQVAAVFGLEERVVVAQRGSLLVGNLQRKAQHGRVDPTLRSLDQAPYRALGRAQGICDKAQVPGVGQLREAVVLLPEGKFPALRLPGHPLVAVEDHQRVERRVRAEADDHVAPVAVHDVEGVVVHPRPRLLALDPPDPPVGGVLDVPDIAGRPAHDDREHALEARVVGNVAPGQILVPVPSLAVHDRYARTLRPALHPAGKAPRHPHEPRVVQPLVRSLPVSPPHPQPRRALAKLEVGAEHYAIHAVVAAVQKPFEEDAVGISRPAHRTLPFV